MRLVSVKVPKGKGAEIARVAFDSDIAQVAARHEPELRHDGSSIEKDVVDVALSTPRAKPFIERVMAQPFYDPRSMTIQVRQPPSIVSSQPFNVLTRPIWAPTTDVSQELWQFSQITSSFVVRFLVAALLLSYGMIREHLLLLVAGLMFLPILPLLLAVSFGSWTRDRKLLAQGLAAFAVATALLVAGGALAALIAEPPLQFDDFPPMEAGFLVSLVVGAAAAIATADDVGRRELIGLAAASQVALLPALLGISLVYGSDEDLSERALSFALNVGALLVTSAIAYAGMRMRPPIAS